MKRITSPRQQQGYLTLVTVVLIVIIGFIAVTLTYIMFGSAFGEVNLQASVSALYLAESGLEDGTHELLSTTLSNRSICSGLSLTNAAIGSGTYTVTSTGPFSVSSPASLSSTITASATTIPASTTTGYQSAGRIMIDGESINYTGVTSSSFTGVTRGVDGTIASAHATGALIGQYQCNLSSQGGIPNLTTAFISAKRMLTEAIQLPIGIAGGNNLSGSAWNVVDWNSPTEKQWTAVTISISPPQVLNGVSITSLVDAWIVGNKAVALHFNGSSWTNITTGLPGGDNLLSVSSISSQEAWASASTGKVYKWSGGASWALATTPGNTLNGISMLDTTGTGTANTGWVVGTNKTAFHYSGSSWASLNTGISVALNGVSTLSTTDAWAVGVSGNIFHWTGGASWTTASSPTTNALNGISMMQSGGSDIGWAVGNSSTAVYYNGSTWTLKTTGLAGGLTLNGVSIVSANEAWTVASNGNIYQWDGSTWSLIYDSAASLNAISMLYPKSHPFSAWNENFG